MNPFFKTLGGFTPNCRQAIRLQSDARERPLTPSQRIGLRIHLWLCVWCRRYGRQLGRLRSLARNCDPGEAASPGLSAAARARIKQALQNGKN